MKDESNKFMPPNVLAYAWSSCSNWPKQEVFAGGQLDCYNMSRIMSMTC